MKNIVRYGIIQLSFFISLVCAFNIDIKHPKIFDGAKDSYFGFAVALIKNRQGRETRALITAPRANSSRLLQVRRPGILNNCKVSFGAGSSSCVEVLLDETGNTYNSRSYNDLKDDMFLGVSLDVQQKGDDVVTCGHLWKNQLRTNYLANGACYVINKDLDESKVRKLVPLTNQRYQDKKSGNASVYYYAFGQAGMAAAFSEDEEYLYLGAPGFYNWAGTVLSFSTKNYNSPIIPDPPDEQKRLPASYIGYSVTSGKFFEERDNFIAVGAPRDWESYGQVYIINPLKNSGDRFIVNSTMKGKQFGEYFGAVVSAVNLNNDTFTDLLIGAPFNSDMVEMGQDEGRVYVYISNGKVLIEEPNPLKGNNIKSARFGSAIAPIGDINKDGYNDVAIGAPYEDGNGAVYIYHGNSKGVNAKYAQRISASEISPRLSGFGISISRGLDVDDNKYLDILIGSYASNQAVLLRTYPIIQVTSTMTFNPKKINTNNTACVFGGRNVPCLNISVCLKYTGKNVAESLNFDTTLYMDKERFNSATLSRGLLIQEGKSKSVVKERVKLDRLKENCFTYQGYIKHDAKDVISPVNFLFQYNIAKDSTNDSFCKNCPIIDPESSMNNSKLIYFQTDCESDTVCHSDLVVKVPGYSENKNKLIIGGNTSLSLEIEVTNIGEAAYQSELLIYLSSSIPYINQDICTKITDQQQQENSTLLCELGKLAKNQTVKILIKVDVSKLPTNTQKLDFIFKAKTDSTEINPQNNNLTLSYYFKALSDVSITGKSEPEEIQFTTDKERKHITTHTYFIRNYGPSPVRDIDIKLYVPFKIKKGNKYAQIVSQIKADSGEHYTIQCNDSSLEQSSNTNQEKPMNIPNDDKEHGIIPSKLTRIKRDVSIDQNETRSFDSQYSYPRTKKSLRDSSGRRIDLVIDCNTTECTLIQCTAPPFLYITTFAKISITMQLQTDILNDYFEPWSTAEFITRGHISIKDEPSDIQPEKHQPDEFSVKTTLVKPPASKGIPNWIIYVSIFVGILLFIIILITLIKVGFFKRQQKEKMNQMLIQADLKEWEQEPKTSDNPALNNA